MPSWYTQRGCTDMMLRDDDDVRKLLTVVTSGLMADPFSLDEEDDANSLLINSHMCVDAERLVSSFEIGTA